MDPSDLTSDSYWSSSYTDYWKERLNTRNQFTLAPPSDEVLTSHMIQVPRYGQYILDCGCGWGRLFDFYRSHSPSSIIHGVDLSQSMLNDVKLHHLNSSNVFLHHSSAELLPFPDESFDNIFCIATFDCTNQLATLNEFLRVAKNNSFIFITGKNISYCPNDTEALSAEIGARKNSHPNFFTDLHKLCRLLAHAGNHITFLRYFQLRGDFSLNNY